MDNYIIIRGAPLWVFLGLVAVIIVAFIALGVSYIKECRDKQYYYDKYRALLRENSCLQLNAISNDVKAGNVNVNRSK